jgi:hypothetical protein
MAVTLRGRFVEAEATGEEKITGFNLEYVTVVEADPQAPADIEGTTVSLDMPSAAGGENWVGKEVTVEGDLEKAPAEEGDVHWVLTAERIEEA